VSTPSPTAAPTPSPSSAPQQNAQAAGQGIMAAASVPAVTQPTSTPLSPLLTGGNAKFTSPLDPFLKQVATNQNPASQLQGQQGMQQTRVQAPPPSNYFNYGQSQSIEDVLGLTKPTNDSMFDFSAVAGFKKGGMAAPLMAKGGMSTPLMAQGGTRYGKNAHGALDIVHAAGKPRVDYRKGDAVTGIGDGQSDDIPAMLADGEFVFPADVVSALGNGSTKAGSDKLYEMMHNIRKRARSTDVKDLPPPAKSPLEYLSGKSNKRRR
jgi:hypothetical protein